MLDRRASTGRRNSWALVAALAALIGLSGQAGAADWADFPPTSFKIHSADGSQVIGKSHFFVERLGPGELRLHGENHYFTGQYDIELDTMEINPGEEIPRLKSFSHIFYQLDGSRFIAGTADVKTGETVCLTKEQGPERRYTAKLDFPPDTYAGASLLIPIEHALRKGVRGPIRMHFFDCTPQPRILTIEATPNPASPRWDFYPGALIEVVAKPDLGWLDIIAAPFLPTTHAWFDPAHGFSYVGGGINRYFYGKSHVMLVKVKPGEQIATPAGARPASDTMPAQAAVDGAARPAPAAASPQGQRTVPDSAR
jgi:hypothetical protein